MTAIWLQIVALLGVVALTAVREFAHRGHGTPYPWDPPTRLVTSGPYAYVGNPMQLCMTAMLIVLGCALANIWLVAAGVTAGVFSSGIAEWNERGHLHARYGDSWHEYRRSVHNWLPSIRPTPVIAPGRLYVAVNCDPCSVLGSWFSRQKSVNLHVLAAEDHPEDLRRIRYEADGRCVRYESSWLRSRTSSSRLGICRLAHAVSGLGNVHADSHRRNRRRSA